MFEIDFFELCFLAEACIPPAPIARAVFFEKLVSTYYHQLTPAQRKQIHEWMLRNQRFDINDEDCHLFDARYNPDNQYKVITFYDNKRETHYAFKIGDEYYKAKYIRINKDYIKKITKISL